MAFDGKLGVTMDDRCHIEVHTAPTSGPWPNTSYLRGAEIACTFVNDKGRENADGSHWTPTEGRIYANSDIQITARDRVHLTLKGNRIVDETYEIIKQPIIHDKQYEMAVRLVSAGAV